MRAAAPAPAAAPAGSRAGLGWHGLGWVEAPLLRRRRSAQRGGTEQEVSWIYQRELYVCAKCVHRRV